MDKVPTITIAQAVVAITILRDEAARRARDYHGVARVTREAALEQNAYQTVLNILSNVK